MAQEEDESVHFETVRHCWRLLYSSPGPGYVGREVDLNVIENVLPNEEYLSLFLYHLHNLDPSRWTELEQRHIFISISQCLSKITIKYLSKSPSKFTQQNLVLMLKILHQTDIGTICDKLFEPLLTYLPLCLQQLNINQLETVTNICQPLRNNLLKKVPLLTCQKKLDNNSVAHKPPGNGVILEKYRQLTLTNGHDRNYHENGGSEMSADDVDQTLELINDPCYKSFIESETLADDLDETVALLAVRLIVKSIRDNAEANYCKDYQLMGIINGAIENYIEALSASPDEVRGRQKQFMWLTILVAGCVESFATAKQKPAGFKKTLKRILDLFPIHLQVLGSESVNEGHFLWTFLLLYLVNNLIVPKLNKSDSIPAKTVIDPFRKCEPSIHIIVRHFLETPQFKKQGMCLFQMVLKVNINFKTLEKKVDHSRRMPVALKLKRRRKCKYKPMSVHHEPTTCRYYKFGNCVTDSILFATMTGVNVRWQRRVLQHFLVRGICCCNVLPEHLRVLGWLCKNHSTLINQCLAVLKTTVYHLLLVQRNDCGFCEEKLGVSCNIVKAEITNFYKDAICARPNQAVLLHLLRLPKLLPFSLQSRLLFEVVWPYFLAEKHNDRMVENVQKMMLCLKIFVVILMAHKQMIKLFFNAESLDILDELKGEAQLTGLVMELYVVALENYALFYEKDRDQIMEIVMERIIYASVATSQLAFVYIQAKTTPHALFITDFAELLVNIDSNPMVVGDHLLLMESLNMAPVLWNAISRLIRLENDTINGQLQKHFFSPNSIFILVYLCLVFILDLNGNCEISPSANGEAEDDIEVRSLANEDVLNQLTIMHINRLILKFDCDMKYSFKSDGKETSHLIPDAVSGDDNDRNIRPDYDPRYYVPKSSLALPYDVCYGDLINEFRVCGPSKRNGESKKEDNLESTIEKEDISSMVSATLKMATDTINHFVFDHLLQLVWSSPEERDGAVEDATMSDDESGINLRLIQKYCNDYAVTDEIRLKVGQLMEGALAVFLAIYSKDEFETKMLPALIELKQYIVDQSIDNWNSAEHARIVTRTLESILKVAERRASVENLFNSVTSSNDTMYSAYCGSDCDDDDDDNDWSREYEEAPQVLSDSRKVDNVESSSSGADEDEEDNDEEDGELSFNTATDDCLRGYEADTESMLNNNPKIVASGRIFAGESGVLHEGVLKIILEILFELSKKCLADPNVWSSNIVTIINRLGLLREFLGGNEMILTGFKTVLQVNDDRLVDIQKAILALITKIDTPTMISTYLNLFTAADPPVEILLSRFYHLATNNIEIEPSYEVRFPTKFDQTVYTMCDTSLAKSILILKEYHMGCKLDSSFTRSALICPLNPIDFKPWTSHGFTVSTWIKWQSNCGDTVVNTRNNSGIEDLSKMSQIFAIGSNKLLLATYLSPNGTISCQLTRPNTPIARDRTMRTEGGVPPMKRNVSFTNILKSLKYDNADYYVTRTPMPFTGQLIKNKWTHLTFSVAIFPDSVMVVMTVDGSKQFNLRISCENVTNFVKNSNVSVLCVGSTMAASDQAATATTSYGMANCLLFKKSIPEMHIISELTSFGPDFTNVQACQIDKIIANYGLVHFDNKQRNLDPELHDDHIKVFQENKIVSFAANNPHLFLTACQKYELTTLGYVAFGAKLQSIKVESFCSSVILCGGLDVLLYLYARIVELNTTSYIQSRALKILLLAAHNNNHLYTEFVQGYLNAISSILRTNVCHKDIHILQIFLNVAFDKPVLDVNAVNSTYSILTDDINLIYPDLIISIINNFEAWSDDATDTNAVEILFQVLIALSSNSLKLVTTYRAFQVDLVAAVMNLCKMHIGGISSQMKISGSLAQKCVELLALYGPTPPGADYLDELAKLLLLIHEPCSVFITQDRINYYYLLSACPPDKNLLKLGKTAERLSKGLRIIQRKRRSVFERRNNNSVVSLWRPRNSYGEVCVGNENDAKGRENVGCERVNIVEEILQIATIHEDDKLYGKRVLMRHVIKLNRFVHNTKVMQRRRTIYRMGPLYNRLGAHARKKELKNQIVDSWALSRRFLNSKLALNSSGVRTLQRELLRLMQDYVILLPDNVVTEVLDHFLNLDLLVILANNRDGMVRAELLQLLWEMCKRLSLEKWTEYINCYAFYHLANQLVIHPVTMQMVAVCRDWLTDLATVGYKMDTIGFYQENVAMIFLAAMLPHLVDHYEHTLMGCIQLLSNYIDLWPSKRRFVIETALIVPSLVKCWQRMYTKRPYLNLATRPGNHLMVITYQICKSLFLKPSTPSNNDQHTIWDFLNDLEYVANTSMALPVRRGMRIVQAKILNGLLRQCVQKYEPHQKYLWGIRRTQTKSVIYIRNSNSTIQEMKGKFNELIENSIVFIQSKDSQYEPLKAEEMLVKTIIRLGLAVRLKIGTIITWSLSPFRSTDLKLFIVHCLRYLMKSKHVLTYGLNLSIIRIFTKKFLGELLSGPEYVDEAKVRMVIEFGKFLNTDVHIDLWALLEAMSKIDTVSCNVKEDQMMAIEKSIHKYEAIALSCIDCSLVLTRKFVEAQNTERRDLINHLRSERSHMFNWRTFVSRMTHENAPFHNARYYPNSWEIDETEGPYRMRLRLKRSHVQVKPEFLLPEYQEMHRDVTAENAPLQYLIDANMRSRNLIIDQVLYSFPVAQIRADSEYNGDLVITETVITFFPDAPDQEAISIEIASIVEIWLRRYMHKEKSAEIFLASDQTLLFMFHDIQDRKIFETYFADKIFDPTSIIRWPYIIMQQWVEGELSNWEYLMTLNQLGGRSYQDLMQYPVFPWVLADYTSSILDLTNPESYRRLDRPIAVQHNENAKYYSEGYYQLLNNQYHTLPPYHYSSHYSNSGTVLSFLIRIQPYTRMFIKYQDNHFDLPDRTFFSMHNAWKLSSKDSTTDVKELLPEFYSLPEMFENGEGFDFGICQGGEAVNHVNLPPWSGQSARMFTLIHRQALESDHVRMNLHHWVKLIFGEYQRGPHAVNAVNVFHPATYPGVLDYISDPLLRVAIDTMTKTYGQCPKQLFVGGHGRWLRRTNEPCTTVPVESPVFANCPVRGLKWGHYTGSPGLAAPMRIQLHQKIDSKITKIISMESTNTVYVVPEYANYMQGIEPDTLNCITWHHPDNIVRISRVMCSEKNAQALFEDSVIVDEISCCGTHVYTNQLWFGYTSGRIVVYQCSDYQPERLNKIRYLQNSHLAQNMSYNSAFRVFKSTGTSFQRRFSESMRRKDVMDIAHLKWKKPVTLIFHRGPIVDIKLCIEFRIAVSIGRDGRAAIWDLNTLEYVRQIVPPNSISTLPITMVAISPTLGDIVTVHKKAVHEGVLVGHGASADDEASDSDDESYEVTESNYDDFVKISTNFAGKTLMRLHSINAKYVNHLTLPEKILCLSYSSVKEGTGINVVATGFENGIIKLWSSWDLSFIRQIDTRMGNVIDLCFSTYQHLVVLTKDNYIQVWESPGLLGTAPKFPQLEFQK